jgi:carbonic anhydrase
MHLVRPDSTRPARCAGVLATALAAIALGPAQAAEPHMVKAVKHTEDAHGAAAAPSKAVVEAPTKAAAAGAAASGATPGAAPADPLEVLRQRLAGKLTGAKSNEGANSLELRLNSKPPVVADHGAPHKAAPARKPAAHGAAAAPAHGAGGAHAHWSYQGPAGPQTWGGLKPEFTLCGSGQRQSPIDIRGGLAVDLEPVRFNYRPTPFAVIDNGHTVQANLAPGNHVEVGGKRFDLVQFHFHRPSEERIDGRQFEMSVHLVHKDDQGKLAVVAVLIDKSPDSASPQAAIQKVWNNLPLEKGEESGARVQLDPAEILPGDRRYFTYMGSLTTPPCSEGVQWVVMRQPVTMSAEQIELFARMYPMNARPIQQASGRRILQSQ